MPTVIMIVLLRLRENINSGFQGMRETQSMHTLRRPSFFLDAWIDLYRAATSSLSSSSSSPLSASSSLPLSPLSSPSAPSSPSSSSSSSSWGFSYSSSVPPSSDSKISESSSSTGCSAWRVPLRCLFQGGGLPPRSARFLSEALALASPFDPDPDPTERMVRSTTWH